jgi:hypothetical protein
MIIWIEEAIHRKYYIVLLCIDFPFDWQHGHICPILYSVEKLIVKYIAKSITSTFSTSLMPYTVG